MGLDRPAAVRYFDWITNILRGDFGESIHYQRPRGAISLPFACSARWRWPASGSSS